MKYSYSYEQVREADQAAMLHCDARTLMTRAGKALADIVEQAMNHLKVDDVLFVCGGGNNGGDGFVAARLLFERGKDVQVLCLADRFSEQCAEEKQNFCGTIYECIPRRRYLLLVDCVLGIGISRAPEGNCAQMIDFINTFGGYVISADVPSGLCENGIALSPCVKANETVCMGLLKNSLIMNDGVDVSGRVTVVDIGLTGENGTQIFERSDIARYFPKKKSNTHKGLYGSACVLAPYIKYAGAPFLTVSACLRSGVGYTKFVVEREVYFAAMGWEPSCVLQKYVDLDCALLREPCIVLGMGAGAEKCLYDLIVRLLQEYDGTLILDADGLNVLACYGIDVLKNKHCRVVITPHVKEFARLTQRAVEDIFCDMLEIAKAFALEYNVTVLLKSNHSVVTDGMRTAVNVTGSPALAKGGSGDVLSGILAGMCGRGIELFEAACIASYLLGEAGMAAEKEMGTYAVCATDIIHYMNKTIRNIEE